jgi:cytidine deaminase
LREPEKMVTIIEVMSNAEMTPTQKLQNAISKSPLIDGYRFHSVLNPEYTIEHVINSQTPGMLIQALNKARESREIAVSHRNFNVGATVVSLKKSPSRLSTLTGFNAKPEEDSEVNMHAEQLAIQKMEDREDDFISMIVIVGDTQSDKQSGHEMHTLHPCGLCRDVMDRHPAIDNEATIIVSALPTFQTIELYSLNALKRFHENHGDDSGIQKFTLLPMKLLEPFVPDPRQEVIRLEDSEETRSDSRPSDETVGLYLALRRMRLLRENGIINY